MTLAPPPGAARRAEQAEQAQRVLRIRVKDKTLEMSRNITLAEKMAVRSSTGLPLDTFWAGESRIGEDSVAVLWWLARRANGEAGLPWVQHMAEWDSLGVTIDDLDLEEVGDDGEDDNPEGSGPGS